MSRKSKGINAERDLIHKFWEHKWVAIRVAGSGSMRYPAPDLLVTNKKHTIAIECKAAKTPPKYIDQAEIEQLEEFSNLWNAIPILAIKFNNNEWYFLETNALKRTDKSVVISLEQAKKGKKVEEFISSFSE